MPPAAWVQLLDDSEGLTVLELDEALVDGPPWPGLGTQLGISVVRALGEDGRLVATITMDGVREPVAHVRAPAVVEAWQSAPPDRLGSHDLEITLLED